MDLPLSLTIEQQFLLTRFERDVQDMGVKELEIMAVNLSRQLMIQQKVLYHNILLNLLNLQDHLHCQLLLQNKKHNCNTFYFLQDLIFFEILSC